jgi:NAD(P)-dependent dehydrogenase (short-subunit alcohol dehydrogenase family)
VERLEALRAELGEAFVPLPADVSDQAAVRVACASLPEPPEVVILDAGIGDFDDKRVFDASVHQRTMAVNYLGALYVVEALFGRMAERGGGTFVAVSSLAAGRGLPRAAAYCASKAALSTAFEAMRLTYRRSGLRFLVVHPGFVDTPMTEVNKRAKQPMPFLWTPERAAAYILDGVERGRLNINFPVPIRAAMTLARMLPAGLYARLLGGR